MSIRCDHGVLIDLEEKAVSESEEAWTVTGYGSVFNNTDLGNDVVVPGAFAKSLRDHGLPLLLFNHKLEDAPIGTIIDAKEDRKGLWFKAELPKDDTFVAGRIIPQLKRRGLKGTSIGYRAEQKEIRKTDGARLLKQVRLVEISIVNTPMNPLAGVETVKGLVPFQDLPIDKTATSFDAGAALKRLQQKLGADDEEMKSAFLYVDPEKKASEWDARFLICDFDEKAGCVSVNPVALFRSAALLYGSRSGDILPEGADETVKAHLDRYYQRLDLESPAKSLSYPEYQALTRGEREARLRGLGISQRLAKALIGPRDADRSDVQRDAGLQEVAKDLVKAILQTAKDLETQ